jgi:hypothetical protein
MEKVSFVFCVLEPVQKVMGITYDIFDNLKGQTP